MYETMQLTELGRHRAGISAHKILRKQGNDLVVQLKANSDKTGQIPVLLPEDYTEGQYIDLVIDSSRTSYTARLIGNTPPKFTPENGTVVAVW